MTSSAPGLSSRSTFYPFPPLLRIYLVGSFGLLLVSFSTDFRQFEQYLNVTGLDVSLPLFDEKPF